MSELFDTVTASYSVRALADPQLVSRLLGLFAQQDLLPDCVRARRFDDRLSITIEQPAVSERQASIIAEKMRSMVLVESVALECQVRARGRPEGEGTRCPAEAATTNPTRAGQ